jgi:hypothetical protein
MLLQLVHLVELGVEVMLEYMVHATAETAMELLILEVELVVVLVHL